MTIPFPQIDPVAFHVGPLAIRWYALAYITAFIVALPLARRLVQWAPKVAERAAVDDFMTYAVLGVLLGGRFGYVLFYQWEFFSQHPLEILKTWKGGMSFHGGAVGVIIALLVFCWRRQINFFAFADRIVTVVPIGLALGRCANFINGELWGRVVHSHVPWAMVFPNGGPESRHPSELYEALTEGGLLFIIMMVMASQPSVRARPGLLSGIFLFGYACARAFCELYREPDANIGFLAGHVTMGQVLCFPMALVGISLIGRALCRPIVSEGLHHEK